MQPIVIIDRNDQLPDVAAVLLVRAMWRYRSELGPVYLVAALAVGIAVLHVAHSEWWPWLLTVAGLAA
ncbi:hypothetical protein ACIBI3_34210 [Actinomadura luteofluorescens]|uniref:hypothetical protein n=1 Tax=Actinomadura luteofluorescens TaxID=46163 RepID=UPI003495E676